MDEIPKPRQRFDPTEKLQNLFWRAISFLPDKPYLTLKYLSIFGRLPNWETPDRFSELMQIRKLLDRNPLYTQLVDKAEAKRFVEERIGAEHVIPTYWVGTDLSTVDWSTIPLPAIVKPTHSSGAGYFLRRPEDIDALMALRPESKWLAQDQSRFNREWAYTGVPPRIIIEKIICGPDETPSDYRFWAFDGNTIHIELRALHKGQMCASMLSPDWKFLPLEDYLYPDFDELPPKPEKLEEMLELARKLGKGIGFARLDFYYTGEGIFAGEITLYPSGGFEQFRPESYDRMLGKQWKEYPGNPAELLG